jgi:endonuclease-3
MTRKDKAQRILEILDRLYPTVDIPLSHRDPFTLLVAVVLSAQTTDKMVNEVTPSLFARAATPEAMAALDVEEIQYLIRRIGLSGTKAKNLKQLSQLLVERHGGRVPRTLEELEELPGVGHKTASVVLNQAFGQAAFPVDTHIHRLAARWRLSNGRSVEKTERDLKTVFPRETWGRVHLQIIYFGREHCPALFHDLDACLICSWTASKAHKESERRRNLELRRRE